MKTIIFRLLFLLLITATQLILNAETVASIDAIKVTEQISFYRVSSSRGNTTSVVYAGEDGALLIDPNFNETHALLKQQITTDHESTIRYITSTHAHRDHIEQYGKFSSAATIIIPENQAEDVTYWGGKPSVTYEGQLTLHFNNKKVTLMTLPEKIGHTNGDELVHFVDDNVLYVGDYYFSTGYPIIDKHVGDLYGYIKNINFITESFSADTIIIPGHTTFAPDQMTLATLGDLKAFATAINETAEIVRLKHQQGIGLEQVIEQGLPDKYSAYDVSNSFRNEARWIKYLYQYFSK